MTRTRLFIASLGVALCLVAAPASTETAETTTLAEQNKEVMR